MPNINFQSQKFNPNAKTTIHLSSFIRFFIHIVNLFFIFADIDESFWHQFSGQIDRELINLLRNSLNSNRIKMSSENPKTDYESSVETGQSSSTVAIQPAESTSLTPVQPAIFKLNINCLHEIFEWITLNDLISIAGTCKLLHHAAGDFFHRNYLSREITIHNGSIFIPHREINIFIDHIPRISISCTNLRLNRLIGEQCKSLRHIRLQGSLLEDRIEHLKHILRHVEMIDVVECPNREEFYEFFLQHCSNVKSLSVQRLYKIQNSANIIGNDNDWMLRTYPTLKHFELIDVYELKQNELLTFFQQNPQVQTFSTDSYSFCANRNTFLSSAGIQLDQLAIEFTSESIAAETIDLLNELYDRGFFKRLHVYVYVDYMNEARNYIERILSMPLASNALEMFHGSFGRIPQPLKNLKILGILHDSLLSINIPETFPNLERIYIPFGNIHQLLPFIRDAVNLKAIKIKQLDGSIDLLALNREREQLKGAQRLTIYVNEDFFNAHKWDGQPTRCSLIELRRYEACEWNDLNAKYRNYKLKYFY